MSAHTPGPWRADEYGVRDCGGYICTLHWPSRYQGQDERFQDESAKRKTDAALIAAAPDLLAALADIMGMIERGELVCDISHDAELGFALLTKANAALERAK